MIVHVTRDGATTLCGKVTNAVQNTSIHITYLRWALLGLTAGRLCKRCVAKGADHAKSA